MAITFNPSNLQATSKVQINDEQQMPIDPWRSKTGDQVSLELQNDHNKKYEYLTALDDHRKQMAAAMEEKKANGTLNFEDLKQYLAVDQQINELQQNMPFSGPEGDEFASWLDYRRQENTNDYRGYEHAVLMQGHS